ncbi:MMB_0454 family protein [Candidatus Mycoplasma mahonii]|uniref:MMB_0454 family protein n=1 Tax=Candidatus Mycoplasma mahonii TaxID=3004105 RepID=UPI0026EB7D9E|nr:hypothetical protein [Candidatus Mycoplasma mahonii]WKX02211.1 hypothetical protein O3I44_02290 [Candidatus Mycoplasma mahonii]
MEFISVDISLNDTYQVEKNVFINLIKKSITKVKNIEFTSLEVEILKNKNDIVIAIEVKKNEKITLKDAILNVNDAVESAVFNLIEAKPQNIEIIVKEGK